MEYGINILFSFCQAVCALNITGYIAIEFHECTFGGRGERHEG